MFKTFTLMAIAAATLSACSYNSANDGVRGGPQAVHPSTSRLASGTSFAPTDQYAICDNDLGRLCYRHAANDGSQPIID